ncbi:hypothetical protein IG631_20599 [Alternaria alternata]|nr:hypothetical protein IG631_20599 [Alternaria alternata]
MTGQHESLLRTGSAVASEESTYRSGPWRVITPRARPPKYRERTSWELVY